jgi:two-component system, chemotaxis family, response regulator Rcp1
MKLDAPARILLVEDGVDDAVMVREALLETGLAHELQVACDGEEGLELLRRTSATPGVPRYDIVLLDLNLPRKDGRQVLAEIKNTSHLRPIPVLILTTSTAPTDIASVYSSHANAYLRKPVGFAALVEALEATLRFWFGPVILPTREPELAHATKP